MVRRTTTRDLGRMKASGQPIPMVTAYDFSSARLVARAGIPVVLVGDSLGQTMLGHEDTVSVTVDDMVRASASVVRGAPEALVVADMPFMSYQVNRDETLRNAGRITKEGGAHALKLEGGEPVLASVRALGEAGIAVMGHLGLTPQSVHKLGGYRIQARAPEKARRLVDDALRLQDAGAFAIVLELIPAELAEEVTGQLDVPTIGIGSGVKCDGQVQVWHDLLGLSPDFLPRHAKRFVDGGALIGRGLEAYARDVRARRFPTDAETVHAPDESV